jgi:hypothetical protein
MKGMQISEPHTKQRQWWRQRRFGMQEKFYMKEDAN